MTSLILIRHGETDWNVAGRWQGQADVPLNERGHRQAQALAERLAGTALAAIYASDLLRARETAAALAQVTGLPVLLDPRLREIHQGACQGLSIAEIRARFSAWLQARDADPLRVGAPGGELPVVAQQRVVAALDEIAARHPQETVAVVAHGFVLALALLHYWQRPPQEVWSLVSRNGEPQLLEL